MDGTQMLGPTPERIEEFARLVLDAVQNKNYALLVALVVVLAVYVLRKFGGEFIPFFRTDRGGAVLVLAFSLAGAVANALTAGAPLSGGLLLAALQVGLTAAGGFTLIKRLLFGGPVIAEAEKAGEVAAGRITDKAAAIRVLEALDRKDHQ
jgi:H+/Cl- antiporter ClcA